MWTVHRRFISSCSGKNRLHARANSRRNTAWIGRSADPPTSVWRRRGYRFRSYFNLILVMSNDKTGSLRVPHSKLSNSRRGLVTTRPGLESYHAFVTNLHKQKFTMLELECAFHFKHHACRQGFVCLSHVNDFCPDTYPAPDRMRISRNKPAKHLTPGLEPLCLSLDY